MNRGHIVLAPIGFKALKQDAVYFFVARTPERVVLVEFGTPANLHCHLHIFPNEEFEAALESGDLASRPNASTAPPWLVGTDLGAQTIAGLDAKHPHRKISYSDAILARKTILAPLIADVDNILALKHPTRHLSEHAKSKKLNTARIKFWFFSALCFSHELTLCPAHTNAGRWDRPEKQKKFGRPSKHGKAHGFGMTEEMEIRCEQAYLRYVGVCKDKSDLYGKSVRETFKCRVRKDWLGRNEFYQPDGKPYPTIGQFYYAINKRVPRVIQERMRATEEHVHQKGEPSLGKYSQRLSNVLEWVQMDAQYESDRPAGFLADVVMPPLVTARAVCVTSGRIVGVGFSLGSERASAYRMCLFSMAIGLRRYFEIFGLPSDGLPEWQGLSPRVTVDRGPAQIHEVRTADGLPMFVTEITKSYSGQAKATVESHHERSRHFIEPPTHRVSPLNPILMARRILLSASAANRASNATGRLTPAMITNRIEPSPHGVYEYLNNRGRSDGFEISFEQAVRTFLSQVPVKIDEEGVWLRFMRYDSDALRRTSILRDAKRHGLIEAKAYMVDLSLRTLWLDMSGQIIELQAQLPIADSEESLYISYEELDRLEEMRAAENRAAEEHRTASRAGAAEEFERTTGRSFHANTKRSGKGPSRKASAKAGAVDQEMINGQRKCA